MEPFFELMTLCHGNLPVTGVFPSSIKTSHDHKLLLLSFVMQSSITRYGMRNSLDFGCWSWRYRVSTKFLKELFPSQTHLRGTIIGKTWVMLKIWIKARYHWKFDSINREWRSEDEGIKYTNAAPICVSYVLLVMNISNRDWSYYGLI